MQDPFCFPQFHEVRGLAQGQTVTAESEPEPWLHHQLSYSPRAAQQSQGWKEDLDWNVGVGPCQGFVSPGF